MTAVSLPSPFLLRTEVRVSSPVTSVPVTSVSAERESLSRPTSGSGNSLALADVRAVVAFIAPDLALYRPRDAADLCGLDESSITRHIKKRPDLFPTRHWARRHEWTRDEFERVVWSLCCLTPGIKRHVATLALQVAAQFVAPSKPPFKK